MILSEVSLRNSPRYRVGFNFIQAEKVLLCRQHSLDVFRQELERDNYNGKKMEEKGKSGKLKCQVKEEKTLIEKTKVFCKRRLLKKKKNKEKIEEKRNSAKI